MRPTVKLDKRVAQQSITTALARLERKQVLVGIPQEKSSRKKGEINNAELLYIQSNGSRLRNIPARPVIEPAIEAADNRADIVDELKQAGAAALAGDEALALQHLNRAGAVGRDAAVKWFEDPRNHWPPNTPGTIKAKGSDQPLVDTGEMRRAITYVVVDK